MKPVGRAALAAASIAAGAAMAATPGGAPVAVYWMSAQTSTGMMAAMMGSGGGRPSASSIMSMMARGGPDPNAVNHTLRLQLGSSRRPSGPPQAEHDPPQGLGAGPVLPLVSPQPQQQPNQPVEERPQAPQQYRRPSGRLLIYWGCGEHAGPGQPVVVDFAKISADPQAFAGLMRGVAVATMQPPSPGRNATYGEWPNAQSQAVIPSQGSLVGEHLIKGDYTPDIRFSLSPGQDFMAPLTLTSNARTPSGAVQLAWNSIPTALGYFAAVVGGQGGGQGGDSTLVMWTSSATQAAAFVLPDYLSPAEVRRLVAGGQVLGPQTTQCTVPQEVAQATRQGLLTMAAYGDEADFSYPPRPASPLWAVKVRYRSTTSGLLGQPNAMGGRGQQQRRGLPGLGGFLP